MSELILYRLKSGIAVTHEGNWYRLTDTDWDALLNQSDLSSYLEDQIQNGLAAKSELAQPDAIGPPIASQEVWAAGVTYYRSRTARMEEAKQSGGGDFYDRVYDAHRPELFVKATPSRTVGTGAEMKLRSDSKWQVPEPELTLVLNNRGALVGYTIGNDLSSRDIEGENPLYLPQAKVWHTSAALGPGILITKEFPPPETKIELSIKRSGEIIFTGETEIAQMKQPFANLREHLFRNNCFEAGVFLMTGTGIVPPDEFTLQAGDQVDITIAPIGTLSNKMGLFN